MIGTRTSATTSSPTATEHQIIQQQQQELDHRHRNPASIDPSYPFDICDFHLALILVILVIFKFGCALAAVRNFQTRQRDSTRSWGNHALCLCLVLSCRYVGYGWLRQSPTRHTTLRWCMIFIMHGMTLQPARELSEGRASTYLPVHSFARPPARAPAKDFK